MLFWKLCLEIPCVVAILAALSAPLWWSAWRRHDAQIKARRH